MENTLDLLLGMGLFVGLSNVASSVLLGCFDDRVLLGGVLGFLGVLDCLLNKLLSLIFVFLCLMNLLFGSLKGTVSKLGLLYGLLDECVSFGTGFLFLGFDNSSLGSFDHVHGNLLCFVGLFVKSFSNLVGYLSLVLGTDGLSLKNSDLVSGGFVALG
jgi:hypothetical protein